MLAARTLAEAGRHAEAIARLSPACPRPAEHLLPCRIESLPSGAHVRLSNGTQRTTPVVRECAPEWLLFDFNHPLAGLPVQFEVHVLGVL